MNLLSPSEILVLQTSFAKISREADRAADLFFARLDEFDPALRTLADVDFCDQKKGFIRLLGTVVHRLDCLDLVRDHLLELALDHAEVSASEEHHHFIGAAFFWMLEEILQDDFRPDCYAAWMTVFRLLSDDLCTTASRLAAVD